ncbi:MAG: V-type ATPase 116kDa subunit family protein [Oryzomonas sp.]|uniref:V-type ATPase 116kDa subunit family protein n=1 Tax=Oryzomonas sp. TaxID=2855186 RepID=UPI00283DF6F1|nr:V-type ATPase 116kDa subunit family protein [Oryzomonas sp.]MDR3578696.1 V-type ATPase 116kDa subunit family protein [Oryzomonas sp.]
MIVAMSKVEIIGPMELLFPVLDQVRSLGMFQVEQDMRGFVDKEEEKAFQPVGLDKKTLTERLYFENLSARIDQLATFLPKLPLRCSYLEPQSVVATVADVIDKHTALCGGLCRLQDTLRGEREELLRQTAFLDALEPLFRTAGEGMGLDFIGVSLKSSEAVDPLYQLISRLTDGAFAFVTANGPEGTVIVLITVPAGLAGQVRDVLNGERIPELVFPASIGQLPFPDKVKKARQRISDISGELERINAELQRFAARWGPTYHCVREWVLDRLGLLTTTVAIHKTDFCFFIHGWMPSPDVKKLRAALNGHFCGRVIVEEREVLEEEMDAIPIAIRNPPYFRPFELFSRILPLPSYRSYDPTPFIGIFFPIFFGMILGDVGYGLLLLVGALVMLKLFRTRRNLHDAALILLVSSCYAVVFGFLYGECFGGSAGGWSLLKKTCVIERSRSIMPMLAFSLSIGVVHITLGLALGLWSALRRKAARESLAKFVSILMLLCLTALAASLFTPFPYPVRMTLNVAVLAAIPLMLLTGGLLAPLEMMKNVGNIISYARIMAIGLASVLIAQVANRFAGLTGDVLTGAVAAGLIHVINIALGIFSPTIHALRLHYVEFFDKFIVYGGRRFEPFKKTS